MRAARLICTALVALALAAPATVAGAAASRGPAASAATAPPGYVIVSSPEEPVLAGSQQTASAACPTANGVQLYPLSGGVFVPESATGLNISGSRPSGTLWLGVINNATAIQLNYYVVAICAQKPSGYRQIHSGPRSNPAMTQSRSSLKCPTGTKISGGGGVVNSTDVASFLSSSMPQNNGWTIASNNGTASPGSYNIYAVCGSWPSTTHYGVHVGSVATISGNGVGGSANASCPNGQSQLGGGILAASHDIRVGIGYMWINSATLWIAGETNGSPTDTTAKAAIICAT